MLPFLRDGDVLTIIPAESSVFRPGDVALYRDAHGFPRVHRVLAGRTAGDRAVLRVRGDAGRSSPEIVPIEDVLGKAVCLQRGRRRIDLDRAFRRGMGLAWAGIQTARAKAGARLRRAAGRGPPGRRVG